MGLFIFWIAIMALAALIVIPQVREWREQGHSVNVSYRAMWQKRIFRYRLLMTAEEAVERLGDQRACAGVAYAFDPALLQVTLHSELPDGTVPATFQLNFEQNMMIVTRLAQTTKAGPIQLAMGEFWREKLDAEFVNCE